LGDGTVESNTRIQHAVDELWSYTGEMFIPVDYEKTSEVNFDLLQTNWFSKIKTVFAQAKLPVPENVFMQTGGKTGTHTEHLGLMLTELQYIQRTYPNCKW
ncbi:MAG: Phenylacetic acid catabolic protein, partial [Chitinophagaceae bacterium]